MRKAPYITTEGYDATAGYSATSKSTSAQNDANRPAPPKGWKQPDSGNPRSVLNSLRSLVHPSKSTKS